MELHTILPLFGCKKTIANYRMHLVQLLLPLYNPEGELFPHTHYAQLRTRLAERFGGITTYTRSPATGLWKESDNKTVRDEIIIYEVMAEELDREWWQAVKDSLEDLFDQEEIVIRTWEIERF